MVDKTDKNQIKQGQQNAPGKQDVRKDVQGQPTPSVQNPNRTQPGGRSEAEKGNVDRSTSGAGSQGGGTGRTDGGLSNQGHVGQGMNRDHRSRGSK
jgi:hypothetical protein